MKKLLFIISCVTISTVGFAQFSAGSKMIGGSVGFISDKEEGNPDDYTYSGFVIQPSFGYFISETFAVGLDLSYSSATEDDFGFETKFSEFAVGPFARMYKFTSNEKFAFFGEASLLFGSGKEEPDGAPDPIKSSSMTIAISPGFAYFFSDKWVLDLKLQGIAYRTSDPNTDSAAEDDKESTLIFGVDSFNPSLGFRFVF